MPSSYTTSLRLTLPATGELAGQWGNTVNTGITELLDAAVAGTASISTWGGAGVAYTLSNNSGTADEARKMFIVATGSPGEAKNVICPAVSKFYVFRNDTTGGFALTLKTPSGTGVSVPAGQYKFLYCDGTNVVEMFNSVASLRLSSLTSGRVTYAGTAGLLQDSANFTFNGTDLTVSGAVNAGTVNATTLDLTNIEVTNIKAKDGTASASIADSTGVMSLVANPVFSGGTANGVLYLNGSKVATSGSALTFDGTNLGMSNGASVSIGGNVSLYGDANQTVIRGRVTNGTIFQDSAGSEQMRLTSTGLGIGTSSPAYKLDVSGTTSRFQNGAIVGSVSALANRFFYVSGNTGTSGADQFGTVINPTLPNTVTGSAYGFYTNLNISSGATVTNAYGLYIDALSAPSGTITNKYGLYIADTNNNYIAGNLGIGTSSPGGKLEVYAGASGATAFSNGANFIVQNSSAVGMSLLSPDANAARIYFGTASNNRNAFIYSDYNGGAQTLIFGVGTSTTAATEKMRLDSSGNLGLGVTPSAWDTVFKNLQMGGSGYSGSFYSQANGDISNGIVLNAYYNGGWKYTASSKAATQYEQNNGVHKWSYAASGTAGNAISFTQAMTLDASGNLLVGQTSGSDAIEVTRSGSTSTGLVLNQTGTSGRKYIISSTGTGYGSAGNLIFYDATAAAERARITSGGYFKASNSGSYLNSTGSYHETVSNVSNDRCFAVVNTNASLSATVAGIQVTYTASSPNNTTNNFIYGEDSTAQRFGLRSNGGLANYSGNDVNLSDRREKTNFAPAKSYLDTICAIPVQTFEYIDQSADDPGLTLGVVAQDVQAVAPELVMESNWGTEDNPKMRLSIYQTDLQYALMKCIQEQQALITALTARVAALEAQP